MAVSSTGFASFLQDEGRRFKCGENYCKSCHMERESHAGGEIVGQEKLYKILLSISSAS